MTATPMAPAGSPNRKRRIGIRARVLAIALIPSVVLLAAGGVTITVLATRAHAVQQWSSYQRVIIDPLLHFVVAVEDERSASMLVVAGSSPDAVDLPGRRKALDAALTETAHIAASADQIDQVAARMVGAQLARLVGELPQVRSAVDGHARTPEQVDDFYSRLVGAVTDAGSQSAIDKSPDNETLTGDMTGNALVRAVDTHARAMGFAMLAQIRGVLDAAGKRGLAELTGAYRQQLEAVRPRLASSVRAEYDALVGSAAWRLTDTAQNQLAERGTIGVPGDQWRAAQQRVATRLVSVVAGQYRGNVALTGQVADRTWNRSIIAGTGIVIAILTAVAAALLLAGRVARRLRSLRSASLELATERLPAIIDDIHRGRPVDFDRDIAPVDNGGDEIGEVAAAFEAAQRTAITAAAAEARTREGFNRVFLDIAFRSQALVRRQLDVLDLAEAEQHDPRHLELLFQLDHLATRARRNAENLLILGDRQPGRRWRNPIGLEEIVRSAASETEGFARVGAVRLPPADVLGSAVADLIHLLAELIDNAASFSPPETPITVHGSLVARGVVVEVIDRGLGMVAAQREQINSLLVEPPEFHEMALAGRRQLGLFVVGRLARRHGIGVSLHESGYGGVTAIVLIPAAVLDPVSVSVTSADRNRRTPLPRRSHPGLVPAGPAAGRELLPVRSQPASGPVRSADAARAAMASFQRGTRKARVPHSIPSDRRITGQ